MNKATETPPSETHANTSTLRARAVLAVGNNRVRPGEAPLGAPGEHDLTVQLECSAISAGTELYTTSLAVEGSPCVLGYAPVGRIVAMGARVEGPWRLGQRVSYFAPRRPDGLAQACGGHQSPAIVDSRLSPSGHNSYLVPVPEAVASEHAAFAGISAVSYQGVAMANPQPWERVVVLGQGLIGLMATRHFSLRGCQVVAVDLDERRLDLARQMGADHAIKPGDDMGAAIRALWPDGADMIADTTANHRVVEASVAAARYEARYVFLGFYKGADFNLGRLHGVVFNGYFPWTLRGALVSASLKLMADGALNVEPLISHRFAAGDAAAAYELAAARPPAYTGILLDWRN